MVVISGCLHVGTRGASADRMMDAGTMQPSLSPLLHLFFLPSVSPYCSAPLLFSVVFSPSGSSPQLPSWMGGGGVEWPPSPSFTSSSLLLLHGHR